MAIYDFNKIKKLKVESVTGTPTVSRAVPIKITSGSESTTGTGKIVLDWTNISSKSDIGVYDENDNLLDYWFESFDATEEEAVIHVYRAWDRDGTIQAQIGYGDGPSDQSSNASDVFDSESDLEAGYALNESSGDALDLTSNNIDGTVTGATQDSTGMVGEAYSFDGTNDYIDLDNDLSDFSFVERTLDFTISYWVKMDDLEGGSQVICGNADRKPRKGFYLGWRINAGSIGDEVFHLHVTNGDDFVIRVSTPDNVITDNDWHHVVVMGDGSGVDFYIDGSQVTTQIVTALGDFSTGDSWGRLFVGAQHGGARGNAQYFLDGKLDDLHFYSNDIGEDDIEGIYAATKETPDFFNQEAAKGGSSSSSSSTSSQSSSSSSKSSTSSSSQSSSSSSVSSSSSGSSESSSSSMSSSSSTSSSSMSSSSQSSSSSESSSSSGSSESSSSSQSSSSSTSSSSQSSSSQSSSSSESSSSSFSSTSSRSSKSSKSSRSSSSSHSSISSESSSSTSSSSESSSSSQSSSSESSSSSQSSSSSDSSSSQSSSSDSSSSSNSSSSESSSSESSSSSASSESSSSSSDTSSSSSISSRYKSSKSSLSSKSSKWASSPSSSSSSHSSDSSESSSQSSESSDSSSHKSSKSSKSSLSSKSSYSSASSESSSSSSRTPDKTPGYIVDELIGFYNEFLNDELDEPVDIGQRMNTDRLTNWVRLDPDMSFVGQPTRDSEYYESTLVFEVGYRDTNIKNYRVYVDSIMKILRRKLYKTSSYRHWNVSGLETTQRRWSSTYKELLVSIRILSRPIHPGLSEND